MTPTMPFSQSPSMLPTDYNNENMWSMLPGRGDTGTLVPPGSKTCEEVNLCNAADVFYLHPTTWYTASSWNAPAYTPVTAYLSDEAIGPQVFFY